MTVTGSEPDRPRSSDWVSEALARIPMPDSPVSRPWQLSISDVLGPRLPGPLGRSSRLLDRVGLVRIGPMSLALESGGDVAWTKVAEIHTRPLVDVLSESTINAASGYASRFLPPIPGVTKRVTRWFSAQAANLLLTVMLSAAWQYGEHASAVQVPAEIVYRGALGRRRTATAGLFAAAVLALPAVSTSLLTTASMYRIPIVAADPVLDMVSQHKRAAALRRRVALAGERLAELREQSHETDR